MNWNATVASLQFLQFLNSLFYALFVAEHCHIAVHRIAHRQSDFTPAVAIVWPVQHPLKPLLFPYNHFVFIHVKVRLTLGKGSGMCTGTLAEHNRVQQGVSPQAIAPVDADVSALSGGVDTGQISLPVNVGFDAAHQVVHSRTNWHRLFNHVFASEVNAQLADLAEFFHNQLFAQVSAVQQYTTVDAVTRIDLGLLRTRHHVSRGQLHHIRSVLLHEPLTVFVPQVCALASGCLREEHSATRYGGGVVLDHFHVHQFSASIVSQGHTIASDNQGVGARLEQPPTAAGAENDTLGPDSAQLSGAYLQRGYSGNLTFFDDERGYKPFFVTLHAGLYQLLKHDVEQGLTGEVTDEEGTGASLAPKGPSTQLALVVSIERHAHVLHIDQRLTSGAAHNFNGILVAQVVAALDCIVGMVFPIISPVGQSGVDTTLSGAGVAPYGMNLTDDRGVGATCPSGDGGSHSSQSRAYYQHIMFQHLILLIPYSSVKTLVFECPVYGQPSMDVVQLPDAKHANTFPNRR